MNADHHWPVPIPEQSGKSKDKIKPLRGGQLRDSSRIAGVTSQRTPPEVRTWEVEFGVPHGELDSVLALPREVVP